MNLQDLNFVSIDFETMTAEHTSACAVGIVKVVDGTIQQKFYSLIKPIPDDREKKNTFVHGITEEMVEHAPTWGELWPTIEPLFDSGVFVCHSASVDIDILKKVCDYYGLPSKVLVVYDTYTITEQSLVDACNSMGVAIDSHHDALCDATACAELFLKTKGVSVVHHHYEKISAADRKKRELSSEAKQPLSAEEVENKETPFFQKKVVITGVLDSYPMREVLANLLKKYGADINSSISQKTNIVIVGNGAGPSKLKKIEELNANGCAIMIIREPELLQIFSEFGIK